MSTFPNINTLDDIVSSKSLLTEPFATLVTGCFLMSRIMCSSMILKVTVGACIVLSLQGLATRPEAMAANEKNTQEAQQERYREAKSIEQAIDILKEYLDEQELSVYAPLFSTESVAAGLENSLNAMRRRSQRRTVRHSKRTWLAC